MAEAAITGAVQKLGDLLIERVSFLYGVEGEVILLKDELLRMQCFLKDAAEKQATNASVRHWVSEIRTLAHDAEDVVEIFSLDVEAPRRGRGILTRFACVPCYLRHLNTIGNEIAQINIRLKKIQASRETYNIQPKEMMELEGSSAWRRRVAPWESDKHAVGLNRDVEELLSRAVLAGKKMGRAVAGIVGMGGAGKSTLDGKLKNKGAGADFPISPPSSCCRALLFQLQATPVLSAFSFLLKSDLPRFLSAMLTVFAADSPSSSS